MSEITRQWSRESKQQYQKVSRENKETFRKEKMVKELQGKRFNEAAIAGMMGMSESSVKSIMKKRGCINLDGRL